jgi:GntR family transcriptional repressor for pyruvate dehydrogenase complex
MKEPGKKQAPGSRTRAKEVQTASREITLGLLREFVAGTYASGTKLPTERKLAEEFGVSRNVMREALKRLEALGLVTIRQGAGIFLEDVQMTAGLELIDVFFYREDGTINEDFLEDIYEAREALTGVVVRSVAIHRQQDEVDRLKELMKQRREALHDPERLTSINLEWFRVLAGATHNIVFNLIFNTMSRYYLRLQNHLRWESLDRERTQISFERIVEAIEERNADLAEQLLLREMRLLRQDASQE